MDQELISLSKRAISILSESNNDRITIVKALADSINLFFLETNLKLKPKCTPLSMDG